ncbi:hypothetical protein O3Q52_17525 [Streptomyces sp. ActVer]|uniref:hypothetical protein n=1 Tax=Streptomyces sp. ActVer TaxID=3014558 RepID=UPI0022B3739B|nr:hypothetical protein [Streptomyces sp. ActVer]MCZ4509966.1 hypothetical protein [Streptomyces sp. ActVer]
MSDLVVVRFDPVQEIAAEPATLDLLRDILRPKAVEPRATPELLDAARLVAGPGDTGAAFTHSHTAVTVPRQRIPPSHCW